MDNRGTDVSAGFDRTVTLAQPEAVCAAVQEWLDDLLRQAVATN